MSQLYRPEEKYEKSLIAIRLRFSLSGEQSPEDMEKYSNLLQYNCHQQREKRRQRRKGLTYIPAPKNFLQNI